MSQTFQSGNSGGKEGIHSSRSAAFNQRGFWGGVIILPTSLAVIFSTPLIAHDSAVDHLMEITGFVFFGLSVFIRLWATMYIGDRKEKELVTQGPYSICRNPLYVGTFCAAVAIACFLHSFVLLAATFLGASFYLCLVIPNEEEVLSTRFGNTFKEYLSATPRIVPNFSNYHSSRIVEVKLVGMRRELKRLVYSTMLFLGAMLLCHLRALPWWPHLFALP